MQPAFWLLLLAAFGQPPGVAPARIDLERSTSALVAEPSYPAVVPAAASQVGTTIDERVAALENALQKQLAAEAERDKIEASRPSLVLRGQLQVDYLWFGQDTANRATVGDVPNSIGFRRARLNARGEAFDVLEYMLSVDFALSGRPSVLDAWVGVRDLPYLGRLRVGHYFEPFSLERGTQNNRTTFMERSLADAFAPARNVGIEAYDSLGEEERASYAVGWFAAGSDNFGDQFADAGGHALTARATCLPLWAADGRAYMHLGAGYSYRTPPNHRLQFTSFPEARNGAPNGVNIPPFVDTGNFAADHHQLFGLEWALIYGPLYIQAEYIGVPVNQLGGPDLYFDAAYVNVSYFLTGESRTYNKVFGVIDRVFPFENFFRVRTEDDDVAAGWGAWEAAARYSFIDLDDANVRGGTLHDFTIGLNWYLNGYTRVKWELIQANLDRGPAGDSRAYIAGMRFDIDF